MGEPDADASPLKYPETRVVDQKDDYFGEEIADPYRWLEGDVREHPEVADWVKVQNNLTRRYLDALPERSKIHRRLKSLWNYERYGVPVKRGGHYFYRYNSGLENQDRVFVLDDMAAQPGLLFDPNTWSKDGTVALADFSPDPTGAFVAYLTQQGGTDWHSVRIRDLESGEDLADELSWLKFGGLAWRRDGSGFFYSRYPQTRSGDRHQSPNLNQTLYFHRVGTDQTKDIQVFSTPDEPTWGHAAKVTKDGRYLVITTWLGTDDRNQIRWLKLEAGQTNGVNVENAKVQTLIGDFESGYVLVGSRDQRLFFLTNHRAPKGRLIAIDLARPELQHWQEILPEREDMLAEVSLVGNHFFASYLKDAHSAVSIFDEAGNRVRDVELPGIGTTTGFTGEPEDSDTFFSYSSFNQPPIVFHYQIESGTSRVFREAKVKFVPSIYETGEFFYPSRDGTQIHLFVAHKRGIELNGNNPTLLYGYGGFNISLTPEFSVPRLQWMEMGGVFAMANLRGGGEYGEAWHEAGTKQKKQNVFDDFIAAAEFLIKAGYTRPDRLAIEGRSNGGLLVGAVINQRPDLFAAALPGVGVMDMLRFHRFTAGRYWTDDYGSAEELAEFQALLAYSPYHNIAPAIEYPGVLITTADTDDRVVPGHSFKYAARLQKAQSGAKPILIRVESQAGHGMGTPTEKLIDQYSDMWSFAAHQLGMFNE